MRREAGVPVHLLGGDARDYALFELEIVAERGSIRIERSGCAIRLRRPVDNPLAPGYRVLDNGEIVEVGSGDAFLRAADNLHRAVVDGAPLACDGATALATERICDALIARADAAVPSGMVYMPFCYAEAAANLLTNPELDPVGKIPEYKFCAAKVERIADAVAAE